MYCIGVDIGGTTFSVGLVDDSTGKVIKSVLKPTLAERGFEKVIEDIYNTITDIQNQTGIEPEAIGIGCPGEVDMDKCIMVYAPNLEFVSANVGEEMKKYTSLPVYIANDASCAAIGEAYCGNAKGYKNSITLTLGTGIGGGIIINRKLFTGAFNGGAEIGHMVIRENGELCNCGRQGCFEKYASATALIREARIVAARHPESQIFALVNGDIKLIDAKTPFDAAQNGDVYAKEIIDNYIKSLAEGLCNIINIFQPEIVLLGGGVAAQGENIVKPVTSHIKKMVFGGKLKTKIATAKYGNDAGFIGAAILHKYNMEM